MELVKKPFSPEFKEQAVNKVNSGQTMSDTAREMGISYQLLRTWVLAASGVNEPVPTAANSALAADEELFQLKVENARLRREIDILRKAAAYFAREIL